LDAVAEVEPWNMNETINVVEKIKKDMIAKGGKIHVLSKEEQRRYLKDSYSLWPEVEKVSGKRGKQFMNILEKYR
jgi:TRAP-type C4-dicarboxylate transport system substrate-binding protein